MSKRSELLSDPDFLKYLFEGTDSGTVIIDQSGTILAVNEEIINISGYPKDELEGKKNWEDFVVPSEIDVLEKYIQLLRANPGEYAERLEIFIRTSSGENKICYLKGIPVPDRQLIILSLTDITEQKEYESELQAAKERAENSERLKTAFLANMSHEIRTPINAIVGFASLLQSDTVEKEKKDLYVNQVVHGSHDLLLLIEKIITISRLDSGQLKLNNREFDLNERLSDIHQRFSEDLESRGKNQISLQLKLGKQGESLSIFGDPMRITEVMSNLVENSIKFTEKGTIEMGYYYLDGKAEGKSDSILFFVKDTGSGIAKDKLKVVFDRFVKIIEKEETLYKGAGLGLAIAREIVHLFGGTIWAESVRGKGSKFYFSYPLKSRRPDVRPTVQPTPGTKEDIDWSDKTVLIAEDVESNYLFLKELLAPVRVNILRARDGLEAVDLFSEHPEIDLVIMDILMPGLDGYEATEKIREMRADIPVIAQSAFTFEGDMQNGLYAGCFNDYIMKPFNRKVLLGIMKKLLTSAE